MMGAQRVTPCAHVNATAGLYIGLLAKRFTLSPKEGGPKEARPLSVLLYDRTVSLTDRKSVV